MADSTKSPTVVANAALEFNPWTNPSNAKTSDNSYATVGVGLLAPSDDLIAGHFDFAIPAGATINGIILSVERKAQRTGRAKDFSVTLTKDGEDAAVSSKAVTATYGTTDATADYGGATDTWGASWTPDEINSDTFGSIFSCTGLFSVTVSVDAFTIKVYYTEASATYSSVIMMSSGQV